RDLLQDRGIGTNWLLRGGHRGRGGFLRSSPAGFRRYPITSAAANCSAFHRIDRCARAEPPQAMALPFRWPRFRRIQRGEGNLPSIGSDRLRLRCDILLLSPDSILIRGTVA